MMWREHFATSQSTESCQKNNQSDKALVHRYLSLRASRCGQETVIGGQKCASSKRSRFFSFLDSLPTGGTWSLG